MRRRIRAILLLGAVVAASQSLAGGQLGYPACKDRSLMTRAIELSDEADPQAVSALIQRGIKSKDCEIIPAGQLVIETTPPLSRIVKVHKRGDPDVYWIIN